MHSLMLVANIFGPYLFIVGLAMLVHRHNCRKIMDSIRKTPAAFYGMGWTSLLIGLFVINQYNVWSFETMAIFVTLLGWAYFLRGIIILFTPQLFLRTEKHEACWATTGGVVRLIWGLLLIWVAMH